MMRGQLASFLPDADSPDWEEYSIPVNKNWRYVQIKIDFSFFWVNEQGFDWVEEEGFDWN